MSMRFLNSSFQFQKVRLKVGKSLICDLGKRIFQFQKVRLKDGVVTNVIILLLDFNSKRFD